MKIHFNNMINMDIYQHVHQI